MTKRMAMVDPAHPGRLDWTDGSYFEGQFRSGDFEGFGILHKPNDQTYEGDWKEGKRHGQGKLLLANGDIYQGSFHRGKKHGKGVFKWASDTSYYDGEWYNNMPHGIGFIGKDSSSKRKAMYESGQCVAFLDRD